MTIIRDENRGFLRELIYEKLENTIADDLKNQIEGNIENRKALTDMVDKYLESIKINKKNKEAALYTVFDTLDTKKPGLGINTYDTIRYRDGDFYDTNYHVSNTFYQFKDDNSGETIPRQIEHIKITLNLKTEKLFKKYPELKKLDDISITSVDGDLFKKIKEIIIEYITAHYNKANNELRK